MIKDWLALTLESKNRTEQFDTPLPSLPASYKRILYVAFNQFISPQADSKRINPPPACIPVPSTVLTLPLLLPYIKPNEEIILFIFYSVLNYISFLILLWTAMGVLRLAQGMQTGYQITVSDQPKLTTKSQLACPGHKRRKEGRDKATEKTSMVSPKLQIQSKWILRSVLARSFLKGEKNIILQNIYKTIVPYAKT